MADEPQEEKPQEPLEPQKPEEPGKPDIPPRLEKRSWFPPPIDPPEKPEPQPGDEPRLPPLRGPAIPGAQINEQGMYRVPDSDLDIFETGLVEPFLGLGMDEKPIEWLWPGYVPIGKLTLIEGESASGKSFVAADIAARVSRGQPWPGRIQGPQRAWDVLYVSFEDSREDTLAPRLRQAGADFGRFQFLTAISEYDALKKKGETVKNRQPAFNADLVHLEFAIHRNENVRLVVIDSLPGLCRDKKTYRQTLRQLEEIARRRNVAIVATARPSTRSRGRPKVEGDKLSEEVRCLFNVLCDPEDPQAPGKQRRFLAPVRMNFCEEPEWLAFRIENGALAWETPTDGAPLSNCLASPTRQKAVRLHEAMDWLSEALKDEDQPAAVMNRQARAQGFSDMTVRRACERLEVRHIRCEFGPVGLWMWALPKPDEERTAAEESKEDARSSPNETPPDPPLRRGGRRGATLPSETPSDPALRRGRSTGSGPRTPLRRAGTGRSGKSPKGKNGRQKVSESSLPELVDRFGSNAGWRELFADVLAGLGGGERRPSTGRPRKPR